MKHYTKAELKARAEKETMNRDADVVMSDAKHADGVPTVTKSTGKATGKVSDKNVSTVVVSTLKAHESAKQPVKKQSKSALIKNGLCPHCEIKLPTFDDKTHRTTCSKCGHVIYFLSARALTCITCRKQKS